MNQELTPIFTSLLKKSFAEPEFTSLEDNQYGEFVKGFTDNFISSYKLDDADNKRYYESLAETTLGSYRKRNDIPRFVPTREQSSELFERFPDLSLVDNIDEREKKVDEWRNKSFEKASALRPAEREDIGVYLDALSNSFIRESASELNQTNWAGDKAYRFAEAFVRPVHELIDKPGAERAWSKIAPEDPNRDEDFSSMLASGFGQAGMQILTAAGLSAAGAPESIPYVFGAMFGAQYMKDGYYNEMRRSGDEDKAWDASVSQIPAAFLETIGDVALIRGVTKTARGYGKAFASATTEAEKRAVLREALPSMGKATMDGFIAEFAVGGMGAEFASGYGMYKATGNENYLRSFGEIFKSGLAEGIVGAVTSGSVHGFTSGNVKTRLAEDISVLTGFQDIKTKQEGINEALKRRDFDKVISLTNGQFVDPSQFDAHLEASDTLRGRATDENGEPIAKPKDKNDYSGRVPVSSPISSTAKNSLIAEATLNDSEISKLSALPSRTEEEEQKLSALTERNTYVKGVIESINNKTYENPTEVDLTFDDSNEAFYEGKESKEKPKREGVHEVVLENGETLNDDGAVVYFDKKFQQDFNTAVAHYGKENVSIKRNVNGNTANIYINKDGKWIKTNAESSYNVNPSKGAVPVSFVENEDSKSVKVKFHPTVKDSTKLPANFTIVEDTGDSVKVRHSDGRVFTFTGDRAIAAREMNAKREEVKQAKEDKKKKPDKTEKSKDSGKQLPSLLDDSEINQENPVSEEKFTQKKVNQNDPMSVLVDEELRSLSNSERKKLSPGRFERQSLSDVSDKGVDLWHEGKRGRVKKDATTGRFYFEAEDKTQIELNGNQESSLASVGITKGGKPGSPKEKVSLTTNKPSSEKKQSHKTLISSLKEKLDQIHHDSIDRLSSISGIINKLISLGVEYKVMSREEIAKEYGENNSPGFATSDGKIVFNLDALNATNKHDLLFKILAIHESAHAGIYIVAQQNPELYQAAKESVNNNPELIAIAREEYGKYDNGNYRFDSMNQDGIFHETIRMIIEGRLAGRTTGLSESGPLKAFLQKLIDYIRNIMWRTSDRIVFQFVKNVEDVLGVTSSAIKIENNNITVNEISAETISDFVKIINGEDVDLENYKRDQLHDLADLMRIKRDRPDIKERLLSRIKEYKPISDSSNTNIINNSYVGPKAETSKFMKDSLETAKAMVAAGKSSEEIRAVTGWFPGKYDGKMRWEIPDNKMKWIGPKSFNEMMTEDRIRKSNKGGDYYRYKLGNVIEHKELFDAYPEAKNIALDIVPSLKSLGSSFLNAIKLAPSWNLDLSPEVFSSTILHEIQHWIQLQEGFAEGGTPESAGGSKNYRNLAGEIESRDIEARKNLTPEQRKAIEPYSSENIANEDAIVMFGGNEANNSISNSQPITNERVARHTELEEKFNNKTITPEETAEAQRIVNAAWKAAGYITRVFRGDKDQSFTVFDKAKLGTNTANLTAELGFAFTSDEGTARYYSRGQNPRKMLLRGKIAQLTSKDWDAILDTVYPSWDALEEYQTGQITLQDLLNKDRAKWDVIKKSIDAQMIADGSTILEVLPDPAFAGKNADRSGSQFFVSNPSQIKSADPFTGVSLDKRFDSTNNNIQNSQPIIVGSDFFADSGKFYRVIQGDESLNDILQSGEVRTNAAEKIKSGMTLAEKMAARPTAFPSFSKGSASMSYAAENPNHSIIVTADKSLQPSTSGRHSAGKTHFPTVDGVHQKSLGNNFQVYKHIGNGEYELVFDKGMTGEIDNVPFSLATRRSFLKGLASSILLSHQANAGESLNEAMKGVGTNLSPEEEVKFQAWKAKYAPMDSGSDYDLRGAFKEGITPDGERGHFPDTYKFPNHPTFSKESKYSTPEHPGGEWGERNGRTTFTPSEWMADDASRMEDLKKYFKKVESDAELIMPGSGGKPVGSTNNNIQNSQPINLGDKFSFRLANELRNADDTFLGLKIANDRTLPVQNVIAKISKSGVNEFEVEKLTNLVNSLEINGRVNIDELSEAVDNEPTLVVNTLDFGGTSNSKPYKIEIQNLTVKKNEIFHKIDTEFSGWTYDQYLSVFTSPDGKSMPLSQAIEAEPRGRSMPQKMQDYVNQAIEIQKQISSIQLDNEGIIDMSESESATGRFDKDPYSNEVLKGLEEIEPGHRLIWSGDLSLNIPSGENKIIRQRKVDNYEQINAFANEVKFTYTQHYQGEVADNQLAFVRGGIHEYQKGNVLPDGTIAKDTTRIFEIWEVQSDWDSIEELGTPLLKYWESLALKAVINHAKKQGASNIIISDADTAMMTQGHDARDDFKYTLKSINGKSVNLYNSSEATVYTLNGEVEFDGDDIFVHTTGNQDESIKLTFRKKAIDSKIIPEAKELVEIINNAKNKGLLVSPELFQEKGMRAAYDDKYYKRMSETDANKKGLKIVPNTTDKEGIATVELRGRIPKGLSKLSNSKGKKVTVGEHNKGPSKVFKNPDGTPKNTNTGLMFPVNNNVELQFSQPITNEENTNESESKPNENIIEEDVIDLASLSGESVSTVRANQIKRINKLRKRKIEPKLGPEEKAALSVLKGIKALAALPDESLEAYANLMEDFIDTRSRSDDAAIERIPIEEFLSKVHALDSEAKHAWFKQQQEDFPELQSKDFDKDFHGEMDQVKAAIDSIQENDQSIGLGRVNNNKEMYLEKIDALRDLIIDNIDEMKDNMLRRIDDVTFNKTDSQHLKAGTWLMQDTMDDLRQYFEDYLNSILTIDVSQSSAKDVRKAYYSLMGVAYDGYMLNANNFISSEIMSLLQNEASPLQVFKSKNTAENATKLMSISAQMRSTMDTKGYEILNRIAGKFRESIKKSHMFQQNALIPYQKESIEKAQKESGFNYSDTHLQKIGIYALSRRIRISEDPKSEIERNLKQLKDSVINLSRSADKTLNVASEWYNKFIDGLFSGVLESETPLQKLEENASIVGIDDGMKGYVNDIVSFFDHFKPIARFTTEFIYGREFKEEYNYIPSMILNLNPTSGPMQYDVDDLRFDMTSSDISERNVNVSGLSGTYDRKAQLKQNQAMVFNINHLFSNRGRLNFLDSLSAVPRREIAALFRQDSEGSKAVKSFMHDEHGSKFRYHTLENAFRTMWKNEIESTQYLHEYQGLVNGILSRWAGVVLSSAYQGVGQLISNIAPFITVNIANPGKIMDMFSAFSYASKYRFGMLTDAQAHLYERLMFDLKNRHQDQVLDTSVNLGITKDSTWQAFKASAAAQGLSKVDKFVEKAKFFQFQEADFWSGAPMMMAEYLHQEKKRLGHDVKMEDLIYNEGSYFNAIDETERFIGIGNASRRGEWLTNRNVLMTVLRHILTGFAGHRLNNASNAYIEMRKIATDGISVEEKTKSAAYVASIAVQSATFTAAKVFVISGIMSLVASILKDKDDDDEELKKLLDEASRANPADKKVIEAEISKRKEIRSTWENVQRRQDNSYLMTMNLTKDIASNIFIWPNLLEFAPDVLIYSTADAFEEKAFKDFKEKKMKELKTKMTNAKNLGDKVLANRFQLAIASLSSQQAVKVTMPNQGSLVPFNGMYGGAFRNIESVVKAMRDSYLGVDEFNINDFANLATVFGWSTADIQRFTRVAEDLDRANKNYQEKVNPTGKNK